MNLEQLFKDHRRTFVFKVYPYVKNYDIAEDLVQEAFTKALSKVEQYDKKRGPLKGWLTGILFSCLWDYMRKAKKAPQMVMLESLPDLEDFYNSTEPQLRDYLNAVANPHHKLVLVGFFVLGYTDQELGQTLAMNPDNVRKIVQRFREREK